MEEELSLEQIVSEGTAPATEPTETPAESAEPSDGIELSAQDDPAAEEGEAEAAAPEPTPPKQVDPPGLKVLLEREKALREQEAQLSAWKSEVEEARQIRLLAQQDKNALLEKLGISRQDIADKEAQDPVAQMAARLQALEAQLQKEQERKAIEEAQKEYQSRKVAVNDWLQANKDKYSAVVSAGAGDTVYDYIVSQYQQTGQVLSEEQAASEVESRLRGLYEKLKPAFEAKKPPQSSTKTVTGKLAAAGGTPDLDDLSEEEQLRVLVESTR